MNWKDEIVTNTEQAKIFLRRYIPQFIFEGSVTFDREETGLSCAVHSEDGKGLFGFDSTIESNSIILNQLMVDNKFPVRELVGIAVKALIGVAVGNEKREIFLDFARDEAEKLLPLYGAMVYGNYTDKHKNNYIKTIVPFLIKYYGHETSGVVKEHLKQLVEQAEQGVDSLWFQMLQMKAPTTNGKDLIEMFVKEVSKEKNLVIDLSNQETGAFLTKTIGNLPPLKATPKVFFQRKRTNNQSLSS